MSEYTQPDLPVCSRCRHWCRDYLVPHGYDPPDRHTVLAGFCTQAEDSRDHKWMRGSDRCEHWRRTGT